MAERPEHICDSCSHSKGEDLQISNYPISRESLKFVQQAADLLELNLNVTTKPGEIFTTNEGYQYPLDKSTFGIRIYFPKDGYGLVEFWKVVHLLQEEAKKEHQFYESIII